MKKLVLCNSVFAGLLTMFLSVSVHAVPMMYFDFNGDSAPDAQATTNLGDSLIASLYISGIDSTHGGILSWGSEIGFDPAVLNATSYSIDSIWEIEGAANNIDNGSGIAQLLAGTSLSTHTGVIKLADITFAALAEGVSVLSLSDYLPGNPLFSATVGADGYVYDNEIDYASAEVRVTAVPTPATTLLICLGVLILAGVKRGTGMEYKR